MRSTWLLTCTGLFLSLVTVGSAKSWDITVDSAAKAGTVQLPAGDYRVKLNGNEAVFTASESGKSYTVPVKIEKAAKKYDQTAVVNTKQGNLEVIENIELGGTNSEIEFPK